MPLLPLRLPPGVNRNGTEYQNRGRWFDTDLVRWVEAVLQPIKGWLGFGNGYSTLENVLLRSYELGTSPWSVGAGGLTTDETVQNHYDPLETTLLATEVTDPGSTAAAYLTQTVGTLTGSDETLSFVLEKISGATVTDIELHDATTGNPVLRLRMTWSTLTVAINDATDGSSGSVAVIDMGVGPFQGDLVRVIATVTPDNSGNDREVRFFPTGASSAEAGVVVVHHAQLVETDEAGDIVFTTDAAVTQARNRVSVDTQPSGALAWRDNSGVQRFAVGGTCQAWAYADGTITEITPSSITCGDNIAVPQSGLYGSGAYGVGNYGLGDESLQQLAEAQSWQFDTWGERLVAMCHSDGTLWEWDLNGANDLTTISNAPTSNLGLVVTPERFMFALGAGGEARRVEWCDFEDNTVWTPAATNQAGGKDLPGEGQLMAGRRGRRETLLWSATDLFVAQYVGGTGVYSFRQVGNACGPISRRSMAMIDSGRAVWMGVKGFFMYNGAVLPLPSEVRDFVFNNMNRQQRSQVFAVTVAQHDEVWWFYPSSTSVFPDRYVMYNVADNTWAIGALQRSAGVDAGVFSFPIFLNRFGVAYEHERGDDMDNFLGAALTPYAQSGPVQISHGDNWVHVNQIIPDEGSLGDVTIELSAREYPTATPHQTVAYTPANPTDARISGRQFSVKATQVNPNWRFGEQRFNVVLEGLR